ncbi:hypothetical protein NDI47_02750 [Microcoleus vaginatus GB1-A2]|uniref:hypothetical protein n=1 Tax=Microcoleus vaginatus TaxID=119532 RepID=UPI0016851A15|nr:hypothetical protein [Microcoleus sp. FACHB-61]
MKKFQVLAGIASVVAIASSIAIGDAASAFPCSYSKSGAAKSGSATTLLGSGGSERMNPWKSYKTAALGFLGLAGVLGGGAAYMSYRAGKRASAACAAMTDNFEVFEEPIDPIADAGVSEYLEVPALLDLPAGAVAESADAVAAVREHPEAPGGELDLPVSPVAELSSEIAIEQVQSASLK